MSKNKPDTNEAEKLPNKVKLNIGGTVFLTTRQTLNVHPESRLAQLKPTSDSYDKSSGEYYFDRDPKAFSCILNWYRSWELHLPTNLCGNALRKELEFWGVSEDQVSECCWKLLHDTDQGRAVIDTLNTKLRDDDVGPDDSAPAWRRGQHRLWMLLDKPNSSKAAKIWNFVFMLFIFASAVIYCMETVPDVRIARIPTGKERISANMMEKLVTDQNNVKLKMIINSQPHPVLYTVDLFCLSVFTLEMILHFLSCPHKVRFFKRFLNWVDVITVAMGWAVFAIEKGYQEGLMELSLEIYITFLTLKSFYILRLFRFFRLAERFTGLKVMMLAVKASLRELTLLLFCIMILATMFGSFEFYCEFDNNHFDTIPISIWWALVTMTTLGYGDYYPLSYAGRGMGTMCALCGLLILAMPIAVIATNFNEYYSRNQCREKQRKKKGWFGKTSKVGSVILTKVNKF